MRPGRLALLLVLLTTPLAGCAYFNSYYNAQRSFTEAERAARRGESANATRAYLAAIDKAAVSYRKHPDSRWADDALLLVGRARFAVGEHEAAGAALARVREQSRDPALRAVAALYLGAALTARGHADSALTVLADGLAAEPPARHRAFGRLWQGRARLDTGDEAGWTDLEAAAEPADAVGLEAALELAVRALQQPDPARFHRALGSLLGNRLAETRSDSVLTLLDAAEQRYGAASLLAAFTPAPAEAWSAEPRARVGIRRARLTAAAGDTALAIRQLEQAVQQASGQAGGEGRLFAARWQLATLRETGGLPEVRALLLPGIPHPGVVDALRRLRLLEALLHRARDGESAGLFASAEFARDSLAAPHLARALFLAYADAAPGSTWAPKALLAALQLAEDAERGGILQRVQQTPGNPYVAAVHGRTDAAAYQAAEEQLARALAAVRAVATAEALAGGAGVDRALQTLDSMRLAARIDSLMVRCGALLDSLDLAGIRADSVRAACVRSDSAAVSQYLAVDTLRLLEPRPDSTGRLPGERRDTVP